MSTKKTPRTIALTAPEAWRLQSAAMRKQTARIAYQECEAEEVGVVNAIKQRAEIDGDPAGWTLEVREDEIVLVEVIDGAG